MNDEEIVYFPWMWMSLSHFHEIFVKISREHSVRGNYGNFLSRIFGKNFVKQLY